VIYEGLDPATGKERRRWYPAGTRERDADRLVNQLVKRVHDNEYRTPEKITVGEYLVERWLPAKRAQLRASTFAAYRDVIGLHVMPYIGGVLLQRLRAEDLDTLYATLLTEGRADGRGGLSAKTVRSVHGIIHKALADAERKGTVARNVATLADPPKLSAAQRPRMSIWTPDQLRNFLAHIEDHRLHPAYHLAANTGMRRGEVLGLGWDDVDLRAGRLSVRQAVITIHYQVHISDVKTTQGRRSIDLDERTVEVLRTWRRHQKRQRMAVGEGWREHGLVFSRPDGSPIHPDYFQQTFDRAVASSGLPVIRLHDLRHTHASLLLAAGVPVKVVSERLGHANPAFTMSVYQHVIPGMGAEAADRFAMLVFGDTVEDPVEDRR
jgi:integrase